MKHTVYCKKNCKNCANRLPLTESHRKYVKSNFDKYEWCDFDEGYIEKTKVKACHGYREAQSDETRSS